MKGYFINHCNNLIKVKNKSNNYNKKNTFCYYFVIITFEIHCLFLILIFIIFFINHI